MAIDTRAIVTCSLGTLISASISDDYIQGSGLIKTKGSCELSGLYSPAVGSVVTFNYTKGGLTRAVPRKMRVLSSFADPFRRTTKVELGCKLSYLSDLKDPIKWDALQDPENSDITEAESQIVTFPIYASSLMRQCLVALGITASSVPLTNKFSIAEFDFGSGYVPTLSDLLVSESYCGYLDYTETLQIINIASPSNSGPQFDTTRLIDVGPIGVGELAGDAVTVTYSSLQLKVPDDTEVAERTSEEDSPTKTSGSSSSGWGTDVATTRLLSTAIIPYSATVTGSGGEQITESRIATYSTLTFISEQTSYGTRIFNGETRNVVIRRQINESKSLAEVAGNILGTYLSNGASAGSFQVSSTTVENFEYDNKGNEVFRELTKTGDRIFGAGAVGISWAYTDDAGTVTLVDLPGGSMTLERTTVATYINGDYKQTVTKRFGPWIASLAGQQTLAEGRLSIQTAAQAESLLSAALDGIYLLDVTVNTQRSAPGAGSQEAPSDQDINNEELVDTQTADPDNGYTTESTSQIVLATGSPSATRRIELSMPYACDDTFIRSIESIDMGVTTYTYRSVTGDAKAKAGVFGRAQNRLLFGNRNGMNIQVPPEVLPNAPFGAFYLTANGVVTQYRTNGTSWTMDSNGIVASTDALYWGVAGQSA
jgi:hypothetical protein